MRTNIFIGLLAAIVAITSACSCPDLTFQQRYGFATNVVKAKAVSVKRFRGPAPRKIVTYIFKLRLLNVFKGCGPTKFFYAKTMLDGGTCSSVLSKGTTYLVQLPSKPTKQKKFPQRFYKFYGCYDVMAWKYISKEERRFYRKQSVKPENQCSKE